MKLGRGGMLNLFGLQTQRQLQVSLEAHGRYINSLIDPDVSTINPGNDGLIDSLPSLELELEQLQHVGIPEKPDLQSLSPFDDRWPTAHAAHTVTCQAMQRQMVSSFMVTSSCKSLGLSSELGSEPWIWHETSCYKLKLQFLVCEEHFP